MDLKALGRGAWVVTDVVISIAQWPSRMPMPCKSDEPGFLFICCAWKMIECGILERSAENSNGNSIFVTWCLECKKHQNPVRITKIWIQEINVFAYCCIRRTCNFDTLQATPWEFWSLIGILGNLCLLEVHIAERGRVNISWSTADVSGNATMSNVTGRNASEGGADVLYGSLWVMEGCKWARKLLHFF